MRPAQPVTHWIPTSGKVGGDDWSDFLLLCGAASTNQRAPEKTQEESAAKHNKVRHKELKIG